MYLVTNVSGMDNNLAKIRHDRGLTMEELAVKANTTKGQIWKLEKGKVQINQKWMDILSKALNCKPTEILYDEQDKKPIKDRLKEIIQEIQSDEYDYNDTTKELLGIVLKDIENRDKDKK